MIYEPMEDSMLLMKQVKKHAKGKVLDMGTGSGIQAESAAEKKEVISVVASDIQKDVIDQCRKKIKSRKIEFVHSDLFRNIKGKFDTIIFNPPYLPQDEGIEDITIYGGKKGHETIERFLNSAWKFLDDEGEILLLASSITGKQRIEDAIRKNLFIFWEIAEKRTFFEQLFVFKIKKSAAVLEMIESGIKDIKYFTKGKRGIIYTGNLRESKVATKAKLTESKAMNSIKNEEFWLEKLNRFDIGPELLLAGKMFIAYRFVKGMFFPEFIEKSSADDIKIVIKDILRQCNALDRLGVDKEEMHRPFKHIIVKRKKAVLIDFERCHNSKKPKNVTQFMSYITSKNISSILAKKGIVINMENAVRVSKKYKSGKMSIIDIENEIL